MPRYRIVFSGGLYHIERLDRFLWLIPYWYSIPFESCHTMEQALYRTKQLLIKARKENTVFYPTEGQIMDAERPQSAYDITNRPPVPPSPPRSR